MAFYLARQWLNLLRQILILSFILKGMYISGYREIHGLLYSPNNVWVWWVIRNQNFKKFLRKKRIIDRKEVSTIYLCGCVIDINTIIKSPQKETYYVAWRLIKFQIIWLKRWTGDKIALTLRSYNTIFLNFSKTFFKLPTPKEHQKKNRKGLTNWVGLTD